MRRFLIVLLGKKSSPLQGNAHGFQISRLDDVVDRPVHVVVVFRLGLALEQEQLLVVSAEWNCSPCLRHGLHTRNRRQLLITDVLIIQKAQLHDQFVKRCGRFGLLHRVDLALHFALETVLPRKPAERIPSARSRSVARSSSE